MTSGRDSVRLQDQLLQQPQLLIGTLSQPMASTMASVTDNNNSIGTRLYVNCPATSSSSSSNGRVVRGLRPDSKNDEDDQDAANGNCENSLAGGGGSSALNGLRPPSAIA